RRIAMAMRNLLRWNAESRPDQAREHGGVALAGALHIEPELQGAVAEEGEHRAFGRRAAGMFEHATDAEAAIFAALFRVAAAALEIGVIGKLQRLIKHRREVAAVDHGTDGGLVRHRRFLDQVALA